MPRRYRNNQCQRSANIHHPDSLCCLRHMKGILDSIFFIKMPHSFLHHPVEDLDEKTKPPSFLSWRTRRLRSSFSPTAVKTTHHHHSSLARRRAPVDHDEHYIAGSIDRHVTVNATVNGRHSTGIDYIPTSAMRRLGE